MRFIVGILIGLIIGVLITVFFYPFIFEQAPASEQVQNSDSKSRVARGIFVDHNPSDPIHTGKGSVEIYRDAEGRYEIALGSDFKVGPGPNFHVYLASGPVTKSKDFSQTDPIWHIGKLKSFSGSQIFRVGEEVDFSQVKSVVIWCKSFRVLITSADIRLKV